MSFDQLKLGWDWWPIQNCPGRYILRGTQRDLSPRDLVGEEVEVSAYRVEAAKDTVLVARLDKGGLISYKKPDGSFVHTLNTPAGFERKLLQLGIKLS
jgi:hypothetical protein